MTVNSNNKRFRVLSALAYNDPLYNIGITQYAYEAKWELDMTMAYYGSEPVHWKGDGIITHYLANRPKLMEWIARQNVPVVSINADEVSYWPGTAPDHEQCGRMAARHFLSLGITNFAFFRCSDQISIEQRQQSFQDEAIRNGGKFHLLDWRKPSAKRDTATLGRFIARIPKPLGILCQSDHRAAALLNACEEGGIDVPNKVAILSVGNNETLCTLSRIPLSSVDTDMKRIAWEGAAMLARIMKGEKISQKLVRFPPTGIAVRRSTAFVTAENPFVAEALRFIIDNATAPINVQDVVRHVGTSRPWLSQLVKKETGRSLYEEIMRVRLERAKYLLKNSDMKIKDVAGETGFYSYVHFAKSFIKHVGCSASDYILRHRRDVFGLSSESETGT